MSMMSMNSISNQPDSLVSRLNRVIAFDRAALDVCDAAAVQLSSVRSRARMRELADDHMRRIDRLSRHVSELGGVPTREKQSLNHDRDEVGNIEEDRDVLEAILENEEQVTSAYETVLETGCSLDKVTDVLQRAMRHQRVHRSWLRKQIEERPN